jgi:hypothetical protein
MIFCEYTVALRGGLTSSVEIGRRPKQENSSTKVEKQLKQKSTQDQQSFDKILKIAGDLKYSTRFSNFDKQLSIVDNLRFPGDPN